MYLYLERKDHIHLLFLFDKNEQEDLDPAFARSFGGWSNASRRREKTMSKKTKPTLFDDLRDSLEDAVAFEQGRRTDLRVTEIPAPPRALRPRDIRAIRRSLNASQVIFARFLNVSPNTIRSWEQGTRRPQGADLKLLAIAWKNPRALLIA